MADNGGNGESGETPKQQKKGFSSRLSSKLSPLNPFKRNPSGSGSGSASDDEDADPKKSSPSRREKLKSGLTSIIPRTPRQRSKLPRESSDSDIAVNQPQDSAASDAERVTEAFTPCRSGDPAAGSSTTEASSQPPQQQDSVVEEAVTQSSVQSATFVCKPVATKPVATKPEAAKTGDAPVPKNPRKVVGGPVFGPPEIVLTGVKGDPDEVMKSIRARGFVVHLSMLYEDTKPSTMTIVLAMGPKLLIKSAVERNLPAKARGDYTSGEVSQLCADAVQVIKRSELEYDEVNLLHDKRALERVASADFQETPDNVHSYFGPYFGIYFAWLRFYTWALVIPGVAGVFLFIDQWRSGSPDSPLLPVFCIALMVWCALFLDLWKRRNNAIVFSWGVDGVEDEELMRSVAEREGEFSPDPAGKLCVTVPIILAAIFAVIRVMLYCVWLSDHAVEVYGEDSYMKYYPLLLHSVTPIVASTIYSFLARALNDFEEHPTGVKKKNMLVIKMFAFQFVNSYCGLLYVAFWRRDLERLRVLLMTMMMVKQFFQQIIEKYQPVVVRWIKDRNEKKKPRKEPVFLVKRGGTITAEELAEEMKAEPADVEDDFLEMVLQFGYISMFAVVFPLAPFFAILNNVWEFKLDLNMLVKSRRPHCHAEATIGAWQLCLEIMGIVACLTNLLLAVFVSQHVSLYTPDSMSEHIGSMEAKFILVVFIEHLLFVAKIVVSGVIDKVPRVVREAQANLAIQRKKERKEFRRLASGLPASSDPDNTDTKAVIDSPSNNLRQLHQTHEVWKFSPKWYLPLALIPFLVAWFDLSVFLVLPIAFVWVSYLQHQKDRSDKALALGVVKDPKVLELVTGFLPAWYTDPEVERVDWLNKLLNKMWPTASGATEALFKTSIQPILDSYRPAAINALGFRKVSLGTIPPKVVGIRSLETKVDKAVMDMELRWAGNAEFVVEAGVKPVPLLVTLNKICFAGRLRVELSPLVPMHFYLQACLEYDWTGDDPTLGNRFPCFGAIALTFMEKPFIDFNFSLGKLEVMNLGPGDMNVGRLVCDTIKNVMNGLMVFPKKMVVPILPDQDLVDLANPTPTGVVELTIVGADNLRSSDILGKSDPYVKIKLGMGQEVKTKHKKGNLNPRFDQTFDLLVYEPSVEVMEFNVYDFDPGPGVDDHLGSCELPLSILTPDVESSHNLPLSNTKTGSLLLKATFVPLLSGDERTEKEDEDVIVGVAGDNITDDTVMHDVYKNLSASASGDAAAARTTVSSRKPAVDPGTLKPKTVVTDTSMGVISVMGIECRNVMPGDRYLSIICGNAERQTAVVQNMASFVCPEVFHFLVKGAKSAVLKVLLMEKERLVSDKTLGSVKLNVAEVIANDDLLDEEWDFEGEKTKGSLKMRLKWAGRTER